MLVEQDLNTDNWWMDSQSEQSMFTSAMLEEPNNKIYLHENKIYFPKENHSIVSLLQYGRCEHRHP